MNNAGPSAYESARKILEKRCCLEGDPRCLETSVATRRAYREPMPIVPSDAETRVLTARRGGGECRMSAPDDHAVLNGDQFLDVVVLHVKVGSGPANRVSAASTASQ